ncbi:MAG: 3D domain-containing protein [Candidatus Moranbacteria bacterium]|jgi:3D (Asp-Asp-Asp) domain-containing protein|nr:3D domain-containing protein [Candidatus Moranbacteria bacterium]
MRITNVLVLLIAIMLLPKITLANQTKAIDEEALKFKIKNNIIYIQDIPVGYKIPAIEKEEIAPAVDARDEKILSTWKKKQDNQWKSLREGKFTINASAYTAAADECGKSDGVTASGVKVQEKRTLACPPQYPFGAKIKIEGYGTYTCEDRGGAIKGNKFDIYMQTKSDAFAFGRRNLEAEIVF